MGAKSSSSEGGSTTTVGSPKSRWGIVGRSLSSESVGAGSEGGFSDGLASATGIESRRRAATKGLGAALAVRACFAVLRSAEWAPVVVAGLPGVERGGALTFATTGSSSFARALGGSGRGTRGARTAATRGGVAFRP